MKGVQSSRLYFVDWLRVLAMLGIFFFHNARFYDVFTDWHVKNSSTSIGPSLLIGFMNEWLMPLFFLIAGVGVFLSLKFRQPVQFIRERSLRLLVPLVFGMVVIVAPQAYFEAVNHGADLGGYNFFQLYAMHLQNLPSLPWYHLWFLAYLFAFSLATLPLFWALKNTGKNIAERFLSRPWIVLPLVLLCLAAADTLLPLDGFWGNRIQGNWSIVSYLLFFISGYLIFADERVMTTVRKLRWVWLGIAAVALA
jgi:glucan biosynthesis protein C